MEQGRTEIVLTHLQDLSGGGTCIGRRRVIKGGHFGKTSIIIHRSKLGLSKLGEAATAQSEITPR